MKEENQLAKWLSGEMDPKTLEAFRKTPEYEDYQKIADYSAQLQAPDFDSGDLFEKILSHPKKTPKVFRLKPSLLRVAAVLIIGFGLLFAVQNLAVFTETAANGQITAFKLPDDSQVVLNSGSEIRYKKWRWNQKRALGLQGEAFFKVAKGRTFDVQTDLGNVTVVGTQFNVKARKNRFEVACFEGTVWVRSAGQKMVLKAGKSVIFENGKLLLAMAEETGNPAWMRQEIRIISLPLTQVVQEVERDYAVKIQIEKTDDKVLFSGTLPKNDLKTALEILAKTFHFELTNGPGNIIILKSK